MQTSWVSELHVVAHIPDVSANFLDHILSHEAHLTQAQAYATFEEPPN